MIERPLPALKVKQVSNNEYIQFKNIYQLLSMNNKLSNIYLILMIPSLFFGCRGRVKEENKNNASASSVSSGQKYLIDKKESIVTWKGAMLASAEEHTGYVHISKGELVIEKGQLMGGTVEIDINTIEYADKENKNTPINHLKSPDYFDVEKFPISTIEITRVASVSDTTINVTGNLTIKGVTRSVTFPAQIEVKDGIVKANGKLTIDRTDWGIRYRSGKFYDILADQIVSDNIEFQMKIVATL
ncbi:YceI family protein [Chitinophaga niabensis]|uniref:Polyisoprenoid-binding protein YceI n=1 Tax=Chitinophaga niabensis TaxID=536979 RepID=A0A1N6FXY9_9BACT|nr:YceI family protein [Chitinophaga niabensis]SIO00138.1 Polyisoprenoid-binding protein YceI [Chitinophaga niabensis]